MKSLAALIISLAAALSPAGAASAAGPILASPEAIVVIGPFPLEVCDGGEPDTPASVVAGTSGYLNLGFFEMDTISGSAWPWGLGAVLERAQLRAAAALELSPATAGRGPESAAGGGRGDAVAPAPGRGGRGSSTDTMGTGSSFGKKSRALSYSR
ncbi:MAG: hypothetical protein CVU56_22030 [Deltaproteobacteria bacterium HGW-Deltaproteobacteria-14]|jgi:hypothetical protein|nr:MAG: hypothetical protein CVU56_22030 [Deltaproteobacteria bacterium HGW-Deltaproteobacteria-14]